MNTYTNKQLYIYEEDTLPSIDSSHHPVSVSAIVYEFLDLIANSSPNHHLISSLTTQYIFRPRLQFAVVLPFACEHVLLSSLFSVVFVFAVAGYYLYSHVLVIWPVLLHHAQLCWTVLFS